MSWMEKHRLRALRHCRMRLRREACGFRSAQSFYRYAHTIVYQPNVTCPG